MIKGLLFDINGTVADILTDEGHDEIYRILANLLDYQGISMKSSELRELFFDTNKRQRRDRGEEFPEFDVVAIFREILERFGTAYTKSLPREKRAALPGLLAEVFRAASRFKLECYRDVLPVIDDLRKQYRLGAVSDGQAVWAVPELRSVGLAEVFETVVVSSDFGYRKPDRRLYQTALDRMELAPAEVIFIGNDLYRDVYGAHRLGMKTVFFQSNQGDHRPSGAEPDYIIYHFRQLPEAIRFLTAPELEKD